MKYITKSIGGVLTIMMLLIFGLKACDNAQIDEANKLNDEAGVILEKENDLTYKSNELLDELLGDNLTKAEDYKAYKEKNKSKFDELISLSGQIERLAAESMDKYEQVLKLKLPEKYKEYTSIKIQEFKKRADLHKLIAPFIKEFLQTNDIDKINKLIEDFNKQSADMLEEADKLSEKAGQFAKDNPNVFKN
jgi:hypothetical protein